ncbi:uncharacterized protein LOC124201198 isoform X2 [Daphnia pulex]|uniref:uncharacterized protein LOC124201198 isoform X2 n=1 Tax=Daphnia pulex TaxID=6669 RepID=UPI001EDEF452|nr:uncharacterized protein LOC124201198 isoform X2 [Daphnia pulex]
MYYQCLEIPHEQGLSVSMEIFQRNMPYPAIFWSRGLFLPHKGKMPFCFKRLLQNISSVVKMLGYGAKKLESVVFNKSHFENFACDVVSKQYYIEIYNGSKSDWSLQYQLKIGSENQIGCS